MQVCLALAVGVIAILAILLIRCCFLLKKVRTELIVSKVARRASDSKAARLSPVVGRLEARARKAEESCKILAQKYARHRDECDRLRAEKLRAWDIPNGIEKDEESEF